MRNYSNAIFVCEFEIAGVRTTSQLIDMLNSYTNESINDGSFSLLDVEENGETICGRYVLNHSVLSHEESDYILTMTQDLSLLLKQRLDFLRQTVLKLGIKENYPKVKDLNENFTINKDPSGDYLYLLQSEMGNTLIHGPFFNEHEAEEKFNSLQ